MEDIKRFIKFLNARIDHYNCEYSRSCENSDHAESIRIKGVIYAYCEARMQFGLMLDVETAPMPIKTEERCTDCDKKLICAECGVECCLACSHMFGETVKCNNCVF